MKVFKRVKDGRYFTITENLRGNCICGGCKSAYTATEYPKILSGLTLPLKSLQGFEEVGEI